MEENRTVICQNAICQKEYSILFDKCPFCGADKPGTKHHPKENEQITCPKCGKNYRNNKENKCPFCGEKSPEWIEGDVVIVPLPPLPLTTTNGYNRNKYIELGIVTGCIVKPKSFKADLLGHNNIFGGELKAYTKMLEDARIEATERMIKQAYDLDADAIIGVRFESSTIIDALEILCYGTAIKFSNN